MNEETVKNLSKLIETFNDKRVITDGQIQEVLQALVGILAENKKGVDSLTAETKKQLEEAIAFITDKHGTLYKTIQGDLKLSKSEIEAMTKEQNNRAFKRLQDLISKIKLPKDGKDGKDGVDGIGKDGKDGSPDSAEQVRDKLETLKDEERLDAKYIKNWEKYIRKIPGGKFIVGGIRYLEQLADVSITLTKKRQDLLIQYNTTNSRWQDGVALTVSASAPSNPQVNDLWIDVS